MEIGLTDEVRKMCGLRPLPAPADDIDMSEKLQWRQMVYFNHDFLSHGVAHDGYGYPAERFVQDFEAYLADRS